ncbi:hypothetical protein N7492_008359 [Penicillium capsulatum]|uniref:Uncharacterized protein n=1 Tax=Penicillium capsulatum TaxID=69766 RepID=A0A9W9HTB0_9EURO|nr:hypothetical protein N7492_008359 [Penicillium capsulatum]KAJ6105761.1 hypothetical protein N7512_009278 [Penicillium capsulatum]
MSSDQSSLYGQPREKTKKSQDLPTASNLAFSSQLSSLIAQDSKTSSRGRSRPSKAPKSDLFAKANKGAQKRAAADLQADASTQHKSSYDIGTVDDATLHRSKRRMTDKVRMYEDMKKGLYLAGNDSDDENQPGQRSRPDDYLARLRRKEREGLVDFDRKWADEQRKKKDKSDDSEDSEEEDDNASIISYEDEFGRSRRGTRAEAARAAQTKEMEENHGRSTQERWKPARPDNLIYGATVQAEAFNPDANMASQMAELAARRDRSPTPPEEKHYDADAEVRNRGTGFYAFSRDEEERKKQMDELLQARKETEERRQKSAAQAAKRQARLDERWRQIHILQGKRLADIFLRGLQEEMKEEIKKEKNEEKNEEKTES